MIIFCIFYNFISRCRVNPHHWVFTVTRHHGHVFNLCPLHIAATWLQQFTVSFPNCFLFLFIYLSSFFNWLSFSVSFHSPQPQFRSAAWRNGFDGLKRASESTLGPGYVLFLSHSYFNWPIIVFLVNLLCNYEVVANNDDNGSNCCATTAGVTATTTAAAAAISGESLPISLISFSLFVFCVILIWLTLFFSVSFRWPKARIPPSRYNDRNRVWNGFERV